MSVGVTRAADNVFLVTGPRTNWCLLRDGEAVTLIDAAWPKNHSRVVDSLRQFGATPDDVEAVVPTHAHPDHIGVAEQLRGDHSAVVHTHRDEVDHAPGKRQERIRITDIASRKWRPSTFACAIDSIKLGGSHPRPFPTVEPFHDAPPDTPGRPVPISTPGQESGHSSFHLPDHGVAVTGEALVNHDVLTNRPGPRLMP